MCIYRKAANGTTFVVMKYILVTGGSRGIGRAICLRLVSLGMPILINYNSNHKAANETRGLIEERGGKAELLPFDVSNESDVVSAIQKWEDEHPNDYISILVNNAGIRRDDMMFMMSDEDWHQVINTTLDGFFFLTRRLLKHMLPRNRGGRIINIASLSGLKGMRKRFPSQYQWHLGYLHIGHRTYMQLAQSVRLS